MKIVLLILVALLTVFLVYWSMTSEDDYWDFKINNYSLKD